jgi:hypothetical protein
MLKHYKSFKDTFEFLSRSNAGSNGIFSISEVSFIGFLEEQKYITKRVTLAKVMLKLYACLSTTDDEVSNKKH